MEPKWSVENFQQMLESSWALECKDTLEKIVRESSRSQIKDWQTASIYPVVGYHPKYMVTPELIGVAVVGTPWKSAETATYLYAMEEELPEALIEWIDQVMDLGDGLDCACKIMLNYQRAIVPVNGESLDLWEEIFQDVLDGKRSTNYHKLCKQNEINVVSAKSPNLLTHNSVIQMDVFTSSFRRDWV
tara:strand:- start:1004 stop:1567 length:564 start_codon:yes stop_codon:yes gene_type:complete